MDNQGHFTLLLVYSKISRMIDIFFELTQISRFPPSNYKITFVWLRGGEASICMDRRTVSVQKGPGRGGVVPNFV
jgi:hypothetical protein